MSEHPTLKRGLVRRAENTELSLGSLEAITEIRASLDDLERLAIASAREKGATVEDIAGALGLTPQAIYYRFRHDRMNLQKTPGEPNMAETALDAKNESVLTPESALGSEPTPADGSPLLPEPTLPD